MTPHQLKLWRKAHNMTQVQAADELECTRSQYQRWEDGRSPVNKLAAKYIDLLEKYRALLAESV